MSEAAFRLLEALALAAVLALAGYVARLMRAQRAEWQGRAQDVDLMKHALLGEPATVWGPGVPGVLDEMRSLKRTVGSNGGSTVFDGIDALKKGQRDILEWAQNHVDEGNLIVAGMEQSAAGLAEALAQHGVDWTPAEVPPFRGPEG